MSSGKKWSFKNLFTAKQGSCGCGPKSSTDAVEPKPISKISRCPSSSSSADASAVDGGGDGLTSATSSLISDGFSQIRPENHPCPEIITDGSKIDNSLAVVQDSDDPYGDFRRSMLQMIFEKEIYSENELQHLLHCFLEINSPHHHEVIVRVYTDIWNAGAEEDDGGEEAVCSNKGT